MLAPALISWGTVARAAGSEVEPGSDAPAADEAKTPSKGKGKSKSKKSSKGKKSGKGKGKGNKSSQGKSDDEAVANDETAADAAASEPPAEPEPPPAPPPTLKITSVPLGATVRVDGTERGLTPLTLELPPGEHAIIVAKPGFTEHTETFVVAAEGEQQLAPTLVAVAPAAPEGPAAGRAWTISGAVVLGLGVAGVATGVAMILIDEDRMPLKCSDEQTDFRGVCRYRYDTLLGGILGTAAGGLGIGGGIAMMVQGHRVTVRARASKQQASLGLVLRW